MSQEVAMGQDSSNRILLCGVQGCCPTAEFTETSVIIRDDFDGEVTLTREQWAGFVEKVKAGELT